VRVPEAWPAPALTLVAAFALGCAGGHRPPAVTATAPTGAASAAPAAEPEPGQPLDPGPDVQPIRDEGASGEEIVGGADGEAGPLADVYFDFDQAALSETAQQTLRQHAGWLQKHLELKLTIEGHCDQRGTVEYNLALGDLRAQAVREYLVSLGVAAERTVAVSYGKERPLDPAMNEAAWAKNRRAHFVVSR
jgi:peptidoglycan-associated lipoprotein